jgi:phosphoglycolate phosphatase
MVGRTVYVGDSIHDMAAGRAAGMQTIGVLWGPSEREELLQAGADELAVTPADLVAIVQR